MNKRTAELIGMHLGDGTLYKTKNSIVWELRGGLNEKEYYGKHVKNLLESLFEDLTFKPKIRSGGKNGCFGIQTSNKSVTDFFLKQDIKPGRKTHTICIPKQIIKSNRNIQLSFIRGYFDTDGCLRFDKNKSELHKYPKIEFSSASKKMIQDLSKLLKELGFSNHTWADRTYSKLCVPGNKMLAKWFSEVSPKNTKHLNRFQFFKKMGFYPVNAAVAQSGTARTEISSGSLVQDC